MTSVLCPDGKRRWQEGDPRRESTAVAMCERQEPSLPVPQTGAILPKSGIVDADDSPVSSVESMP